MSLKVSLIDSEVDGLGHKVVASYSNKAPLSIDTQEKFFSALQSFKDALAGKFGSLVETTNGNKVIVSYHITQ